MIEYLHDINTKNDVIEFFDWLVNKGINFHPDDLFEDDLTPLNKPMGMAFEIARRDKFDIYELAINAIFNTNKK